jgi:glycosyltransferase involved in cell wall biosynthesis
MWQRLGGYRQRYAPKGAGAEDAELWLRAGAYGWKAAKVTDQALFNYSWMSGQVTGDPNYSEVDWTAWQPWVKDGLHPFASYATPARHSHPVRAYDTPTVSVIIPVGPGHEHEVINALDSLEAQTFRGWEAIVVWDYHVKAPVSILDAYPYVRHIFAKDKYMPGLDMITPIHKDQTEARNFGAGFCRNRGADLARAPFLVFLDADDWLYPECLAKMLDAWNREATIVYTDYVGKAFIKDPNDPTLAPELRERIYYRNEATGETVMGFRAADYDCERAVRQPEGPEPYIWCNVTALIPRAWHAAIGGFDESMESWEDVDYHWRHARAGRCYYHLQEELMVYRFYTGGRRDKGLQIHKNLVQYITEKYRGDEPMPCGGCGRGQSVNYKQASAPVPFPAMAGMEPVQVGVLRLATGGTITAGDADLVKVKYLSTNKASKRVVGPPNHDGGAIDYGYHSAGDVFLVHRADVGGQFQPVQEQAVREPEAERQETPAPVALPGVEVLAEPAPVAAAVIAPEPQAESLSPVTFDPESVLSSTRSLHAFVTSGKASKVMLRALLEMEQEGKARTSAIKELERALA